MKIVIVSGGKAPSRLLISKEIEDADLVIGADSGGDCLYNYNIKPDYLLGDFDSISKQVFEYFKSSRCVLLEYPVEKDSTDTEIALKKAAELGGKEIVFLGCTGSRVDHLLGNLGLLKLCLEWGIRASIKDDSNTIFLVDQPCQIWREPGSTFSLQSYCDVVQCLSIKGAKYPLENYDLKLGAPLTISNEFIGEKVDIGFTSGVLMIIYSRD
jgi:thiamine pyrophosphokinase